ncbi:hypothetical protein Pyrfu_0062 [Pyrolobus fumarii 1A]|uniref:CdvA-like coiled-coil domain-containing protein n=1 Tax=Pyrolobus fumarii (strain DSM 11204 / 1A) TaxID=694429 RepID=G0EE18_PYRF1|nr:CdvA-like protein [Pyrolobus fumarii]AEM37934.1 hypothetical protein Pyrfu_0062 [Pyrolobus fumarii 1A]
MVRALFIDMLEGRVGAEVYDPYRRKLGILVSFDSEVDGRVTKVSVLLYGSGEIRDYAPDAIEIEGDRIIVKPAWKTFAEKTRESYKRAVRRMKHLEEMYHKKEIPAQVYREFAKRLEKEIRKLRDQLTKVREMIQKRKRELEIERDMVIRSKTALRLSFLSGEIRPDAYRTAFEKLKDIEESIELEWKDLEETLKKLDEFEEVKISNEQKKIEEETAVAPSAAQPIPVKIIE